MKGSLSLRLQPWSSWSAWRWLCKRGKRKMPCGEKPVITPRSCLPEFRGNRSSHERTAIFLRSLQFLLPTNDKWQERYSVPPRR